MFRETGARDDEASALNGLGEAAHAAGDLAAAVRHHTAANTIAADIPDCDQQARAHAGLGRCHYTRDDLTRAHHHYVRALALYAELGSPPHIAEIRAQLAIISDDRHAPDPAPAFGTIRSPYTSRATSLGSR